MKKIPITKFLLKIFDWQTRLELNGGDEFCYFRQRMFEHDA